MVGAGEFVVHGFGGCTYFVLDSLGRGGVLVGRYPDVMLWIYVFVSFGMPDF